MSKVLLDTNAYSHLLKGNVHIFEQISEASDVFMSVIVLGELYSGFKGGNSEQRNIDLLKKFLGKPTVRTLDVTKNTAEIFADTKQRLRLLGRPIPINDVWIAAHTLETGSSLITFDYHFKAVEGLRIRYGREN